MTFILFLEVKMKLVLDIEEGQEVSEVMDEMEYSFSDTTGNADIVDTSIENYEILDSK